ERAHSGGASDHGQLVRLDEAGGGDQVCDELGERVDRRWASEPGANLRRRAPGLSARGAQIPWTLDVHLSLARGIGSAPVRLDPSGASASSSAGGKRSAPGSSLASSGVLTRTIAPATPGWRRTHATATWAAERPRRTPISASLARGGTRSSCAK